MSLNRSLMRAVPFVGVAVAALLGTGIASAHVETDPGQAAPGDFATVTFRVPNEETAAGVTKLEITFPTDHPVAEARTTPIPGWTAHVTKVTLAKPVHQNNADVTEGVATITWTADNQGAQIAPGEFLRFAVLAGPLPDNTDQLIFPSVQTYSNNDVVKWDALPAAAGAMQAEHPAPVLKLVADKAADATPAAPAAASGQDTTARWLGGAGLVVGVVGIGLAVGFGLRGRRKPAPQGSDTAAQ